MNPLVCCTLLTADRQAMTDRAVRCFLAQTYEPRCLLILDSGRERVRVTKEITEVEYNGNVIVGYLNTAPGQSIGKLRNIATTESINVDIIAHWDSDDWSAPERLAQQVALLQSSGKDAVGYPEMLFWKRPHGRDCRCGGTGVLEAAVTEMRCPETGEAWLYRNARQDYCLGTSLVYWRKTWERKPFPDLMTGEDKEWCRGLDTVGVTAFEYESSCSEPMMVAEIHGGNVSSRIQPDAPEYWTRVPQWDQRLQEIMKL